MNKKLAWILKLCFSLAVLGYLAWKAQSDKSFDELLHHDKNWTLLAVGGFTLLCTLVMQFLRWRMLVRAIGLELSTPEALRIGFMGQCFSLAGVGMLGGDALKTFYLGRHNRGQMTEALTAVLVDRVVGTYGLVLLAGVLCCFFDPTQLRAGGSGESLAVERLCWLAPIVAVVSTIIFVVLLLPGVTTWAAWDAVVHIPKVGNQFKRLVGAMRGYRQRLGSLLTTIGLSVVIHLSNCITFYCISLALPVPVGVDKPSFLDQSAAALLALSAGALPVGGLEFIFNVVYRGVAEPGMPAEQGFLIVLAYRLLQMCIAVIGLYFYLARRREVDELLHEAEEAEADCAKSEQATAEVAAGSS